MKPNSLDLLHQTSRTPVQPRGQQRPGSEQASFARTLRLTIDSRQAGNSDRESRPGSTDRPDEPIRNKDRDQTQDEKRSDTASDQASHSPFGYGPSPEAASIPSESAHKTSSEMPDIHELDDVKKALSQTGEETLTAGKNLIGESQAGLSENEDNLSAVSGQRTAVHQEKTSAGKLKLLSEPIAAGTALFEDSYNGHQADLTASASAETVAAARVEVKGSAAARGLDASPNGGPLTVENESETGQKQAPEGKQPAAESIGAGAGADLSEAGQLKRESATRNGTNRDNLYPESRPAAAALEAKAVGQARSEQMPLAQNLAENEALSGTASDVTAVDEPSSRPAADPASTQAGTAFSDHSIFIKSDLNQSATVTAEQTADFNLIPNPDGSEAVSGFEAANTILGSDSQQQVPGQAVASMLLMIRGGQQSLRVRLRPDHLGELQINLVKGTDGLSARLTADTLASCRLLEANLPQLQQALLERQIVCREIEVQYQPPEQQPGYDQTAGDGSQQGTPDNLGRQSQGAGQTQPAAGNDDNLAEDSSSRPSQTPHIDSPYQLDHLV